MNTWIRNNQVRTAAALVMILVLSGMAGSLTLRAEEDALGYCQKNFFRGYYLMYYFFGNYPEIMESLTVCLLGEYQLCMRYL